MKILLSIKPKHVQKIISGKKKYELRKAIFKDRSIPDIYIYSSSPVKKIIGKFKVGKILEDHPENLWKQLNQYSGLNKKDFFKYFSGKNKGFAIEITDFELFKESIDPKKLNSNFIAPQSFQYIDDSFLQFQLEVNLDLNNANFGEHVQVRV